MPNGCMSLGELARCLSEVVFVCLQLVSGQAVGTLFDLEESKYMQERMEAEAQYQGKLFPHCTASSASMH